MSPVDKYQRTFLCCLDSQPHFFVGTPIEDRQIYVCIENTHIRAVSSGIVRGVLNSRESQVIVLQSGRYFTVYGGVENVLVKEGDNLSKGTVLGSLDVKIGEERQCWLEVYKNKSKLNQKSGGELILF
jgi:hypothetical protein